MDKIFFSYSRADSEFVLKLAKDLRKSGADIWLDQLDIAPGSHWDASIEKALHSAGTLLIILSPNSVASENVMDEVSYALEEGKKVIPILHANCETPFRLRRLQRIDFTTDYKTGFNHLMESLGLKETDKNAGLETIAHNIAKPAEVKSESAFRKGKTGIINGEFGKKRN
ncbi:MAG: toll/interleukin-1 receptor domain-containing protein [Sphingobacteriales bacterium]|nr:toll/interleukin-1 receptor domain-containing protein [Sphingobacteriales bacterium]